MVRVCASCRTCARSRLDVGLSSFGGKALFVSGAGSEEINSAFVDVEAALFSVVGLWFVSAGMIDLAYFLSLIHITTAPNWNLGLFGPEQKANFAATWAELVLGLFLLFRGRSFKVFISNIRG